MAINRLIDNDTYVLLNTLIIFDPNISVKAKAIWFFCMSCKKDFDFSDEGTLKHFLEGEESIEEGLKELENAGYLKRSREILPDGKEGEEIFTLYEYPEK